MKKYLIRYLMFSAPAVLFSFLPGVNHWLVQGVFWLLALGMLVGWAFNTGMAAYHYPLSALSVLFVYAGLNVLAVSVVYVNDYRTLLHKVMRAVGGFLSYRPLGPLLGVLREFPRNPIPAELVVIAVIVGACLIGYLVGIWQRRQNPNPYRPKMMRRR